MKRRILYVVNPIAGKSRGIEMLPAISVRMEGVKDIQYKIVVSEKPNEITDLVKYHEKLGYKEFVAVGGDGTASEVLNGLDLSSDEISTLGVLPTGSGNDFTRNFKNLDVGNVFDDIIANRTQYIDIGKVKLKDEEYYFLNSCSFGIDGLIVQEAQRLKEKIPTELSYFVAMIKKIFAFQTKKGIMTVDDVVREDFFQLIAVTNGKYIGGGMKICPDAKLTDGMLDVCSLTKVSKLKFLANAPRIYKGTLYKVKEVEYTRCKDFSIDLGDEGYLVNIDGNIVGKTPSQLNILPAHAKIYMGMEMT